MLSGCGIPAVLNLFYTTFLEIIVEVMTSGVPQVYKLWLWISKGMLPVKHPAPKIPMAVKGRQDERFGERIGEWVGCGT